MCTMPTTISSEMMANAVISLPTSLNMLWLSQEILQASMAVRECHPAILPSFTMSMADGEIIESLPPGLDRDGQMHCDCNAWSLVPALIYHIDTLEIGPFEQNLRAATW